MDEEVVEEWVCKEVEVVVVIWEGVEGMVMAMVDVGEGMEVEDIMVTTMVITILPHPINYIHTITTDQDKGQAWGIR